MAQLLADLLIYGLAPASLALAIATDLMGRIIPNIVVGLLAAGFVLLCLVAPVPELAVRLLLAAGVLAAGFALFAQDVIGAGDAKLASAVALWLDPAQFPLFAAVCGGIGLLLVLVATLHARRGRGGVPSLPYGVALAGAGLVLLPKSMLVAALG